MLFFMSRKLKSKPGSRSSLDPNRLIHRKRSLAGFFYSFYIYSILGKTNTHFFSQILKDVDDRGFQLARACYTLLSEDQIENHIVLAPLVARDCNTRSCRASWCSENIEPRLTQSMQYSSDTSFRSLPSWYSYPSGTLQSQKNKQRNA